MKIGAKTLEKWQYHLILDLLLDLHLQGSIYGEALPVLAPLLLSLITLAVISLALKESRSPAVIEVSEKQIESVGKVFAFE
jgi:hypothetical protein